MMVINLQTVEHDIQKVVQDIEKVVKDIQEVEARLEAAAQQDVAYLREEKKQLRRKEVLLRLQLRDDKKQLREDKKRLQEESMRVDTSGQQYGLSEDQARVMDKLGAFLLEQEKVKKTIRISSVGQTVWMDLQQKARLNVVFPLEAEMQPTHCSDFPPFGWDDRIEKGQAERYIPHLNNIRKSRTWTLIDAANNYRDLLSCDFGDRHLTGTTDVAWVDKRLVPLLPQAGLRCIFELIKAISPRAGQYQALISLLCANIHSPHNHPFVVLTDLVDWWALYWIDGSSIYMYSFNSRATAVGYIEDLLRDARGGGGGAEIPLGGESLAVEGRQDKRIFKRQKLCIPEMSNLLDLVGFLPDEEIRSAQVQCALQSLWKIPALSSMRSEFSSPPKGMYGYTNV